MLGDITKTLQNLSDHDSKLAKAIDDYFTASVDMLRALQSASQRIEQGQSVTGGKVTPDTEALAALIQKMGESVQHVLADTVTHAGAASSFLYLRRQLAQGILLDLQKGSSRRDHAHD